MTPKGDRRLRQTAGAAWPSAANEPVGLVVDPTIQMPRRECAAPVGGSRSISQTVIPLPSWQLTSAMLAGTHRLAVARWPDLSDIVAMVVGLSAHFGYPGSDVDGDDVKVRRYVVGLQKAVEIQVASSG